MAKERINPFNGQLADKKGADNNNNDDEPTMEESLRMMAMLACTHQDITPQEYEQFYHFYQEHKEEIEHEFDELRRDGAPYGDDDFEDDFDMDTVVPEPLPGADRKTLVLKIQLKGVTKPPMWRELEIPADNTFEDLHDAIQNLFGLDNDHLWAFQEKDNRYSFDSTVIAIPMEPGNRFSYGVDDTDHDARDTQLTSFLQRKDDKMEYEYDFGDGWIFTVTVKDILDKKSEHPVCTKWKGDWQLVEDCGGPYAWMGMRDIMENKDSLSTKEKNAMARNLGYDSFKDIWLPERFNLDKVNDILS